MASFLVRERFCNAEMIKLITCPTLIIHGKKDRLVDWQHSQVLFENAAGPCSLMLSDEMTHDSFDFVEDLTQPMYFFLANSTQHQKAS